MVLNRCDFLIYGRNDQSTSTSVTTSTLWLNLPTKECNGVMEFIQVSKGFQVLKNLHTADLFKALLVKSLLHVKMLQSYVLCNKCYDAMKFFRGVQKFPSAMSITLLSLHL